MKKITNNKGFTLVEIIITLALLGGLIVPLMNLLSVAYKLSSEAKTEYSSIQTAQAYVEEIKGMDSLDMGLFTYNSENKSYERIIGEDIGAFGVQISIRSGSYGIHYIGVDILKKGHLINSLEASHIFN